MDRTKHQNAKTFAYALPLALILLLFASVTGLALVSLTITSASIGAKEDNALRAQSMADDGLVYWEANFDQKIKEAGNVDPSAADRTLKQIVASITPPDNAGFTLEKSVSPINGDQHGNIDPNVYSAYVTVTVKGTYGASERKITRTYLVTTVAKPFMFALVTDGKLSFNGAAYVEGDALITGPLESSPYAHYDWGLFGGDTKRTGYSALKGKLYSERDHIILTHYKRLFGSRVKEQLPLTPENLQKGFVVPPTLSHGTVEKQTIPVMQLVLEKENQKPLLAEDVVYKKCIKRDNRGNCTHWETDLDVNTQDIELMNILNKNRGLWVKGKLEIKPNVSLIVNGDLLVEKDLIIRKGASLSVWGGNVYVGGKAEVQGDGAARSTLQLNPGQWVYVAKDTLMKDAYFQGTLYSKGNVRIQENLWYRSTIYTAGEATIEDFKMQDNNFTIVAADKEVLVKNNNLFNSQPLVMNAYFYSNQDITLYGVGSNIEIHGGVMGRNVILNAAKGKTWECWFGLDICFEEPQEQLPIERSRLKIFYNPDVILNPPSGIYQPGPLTYKVHSTSLQD
ncbi:hypothetical protein [Hydrogenibacillus schlegelii]|nr:hypothetical protein [Hydrogenibacillus schlegelii]